MYCCFFCITNCCYCCCRVRVPGPRGWRASLADGRQRGPGSPKPLGFAAPGRGAWPRGGSHSLPVLGQGRCRPIRQRVYAHQGAKGQIAGPQARAQPRETHVPRGRPSSSFSLLKASKQKNIEQSLRKSRCTCVKFSSHKTETSERLTFKVLINQTKRKEYTSGRPYWISSCSKNSLTIQWKYAILSFTDEQNSLRLCKLIFNKL